MNHPCLSYSCPENNCGQCFGDGCPSNPRPERVSDNTDEAGEDD